MFSFGIGIKIASIDFVVRLDPLTGSNWTAALGWITSRAGMLEPAKIYFLVFGVLTIAGGIMGYVKAASMVSLVAGTITGILLILAGVLLPQHREFGLILGLFTSAVLAAQFIPRVFRTRRLVPAGLMSVLSVIGIIIAIAAWVAK